MGRIGKPMHIVLHIKASENIYRRFLIFIKNCSIGSAAPHSAGRHIKIYKQKLIVVTVIREHLLCPWFL
jgi:hypothetical protein